MNPTREQIEQASNFFGVSFMSWPVYEDKGREYVIPYRRSHVGVDAALLIKAVEQIRSEAMMGDLSPLAKFVVAAFHNSKDH